MKPIVYDSDLILKLFVIVDDLYKHLITHRLLRSKSKAGRKSKLSTPELITIAVIFSLTKGDSFKNFYRIFKLSNLFPNVPEYSRLLRSVKAATPVTTVMLQILCNLAKANSQNLIKVIDSTPLSTINTKRTFHYHSNVSSKCGKSSRGYFYGFKTHIVVNERGHLLSIKITPGNTSDKNHRVVLSLLKGLRGLVLGDSGYLSKELKEKVWKELKVYLFTGVNKTMKKIVSETTRKLMKLRQVVETVFSQIKYRKSCASSLPRTNLGHLFRYITAAFSDVVITMFF